MPENQEFYLRGGPKPNWMDSQFTLSLAFEDNQPNSVVFVGHHQSLLEWPSGGKSLILHDQGQGAFHTLEQGVHGPFGLTQWISNTSEQRINFTFTQVNL